MGLSPLHLNCPQPVGAMGLSLLHLNCPQPAGAMPSSPALN